MEKLFLQIYLNGRTQTWNELSTVYNITGEQLRKKYSKWKKKYENSRTTNYNEQTFTKEFVDKYNKTGFTNPPLNTLYEITRNGNVWDYTNNFTNFHNSYPKTDIRPYSAPTYEQIKYATNMESYENILIIGDIHEPFGHEGYLQHCLDTMKKYQCTKVIFIGDEVDLHSLSFHEHNPNLYSPGQEIELAKKRLAKWYNAFPNAVVLGANHSDLIKRKMKHAGIPEEIAKPMNEIFGTPNWEYVDNYVYQNILFTHGTGLSASSVNTKALYENKSVVIGHLHTSAKIEYLKQDIFTMTVGCVDKDTEFLSKEGWKKISDYKEGDDVLQYNEDNTAEFVKPLNYIKVPNKEFNTFSTKYGISQSLCDEHNMVYLNRSNKLSKIKTSDFVKRHNDSLFGFDGKFLTCFNLKSETLFPLTDNEIRLMVAIHADGTMIKGKTETRCRILVKKERKKERLEKLLNSLNIKYSRNDYKNNCTDFLFTPPLTTKNYDSSWYNCSKEQLAVIADECLYWDGDSVSRNRYTSTSKEDCDFIQYCFTANNIRTSLNHDSRKDKQSYNVLISKSLNTRTLCSSKKCEIIKTPSVDGFKYCFTVPSSMLVLRKNNCIFITGNCGIDYNSPAFDYARTNPKKPILSCGVIFHKLPLIVPMTNV